MRQWMLQRIMSSERGCITDNECDDSDTCYKNLCTNACDPSITPCAYLNKCEVKNHFSNCTDEIIDTYKPCENHSDCDADLYCHPHASDASANFVVDHDLHQMKCYKPCDNDTICEEDEYCDENNHCIPYWED
ncbi:hypothetical protein PV325_008312 [Microctonus aethiopoides]|nr:hypothetical protein PV325_008312 [Microctonus aethiopoides]